MMALVEFEEEAGMLDALESLKPPRDIRLAMAERMKKVRLSQNLTQKDLAEKSGIPLATLRKFETTGEVSLKALVNFAIALNKAGDLAKVFYEPPAADLYAKRPKVRRRASHARKAA